MNHIKNKTINFALSIFFIIKKDIILQLRNFADIVTLITFFIIAVLIFIFSIGPDGEQLQNIGVSVLWTILILSSSITVNKSMKEDFTDGSLAIYQFTGISFEIIALIKIVTSWLLYQLPFLVIVPLISVIFNISTEKIYNLILTMIIGSPIITILMLIASSMMLTNRKNLTLVSLIVLPLSIPIIIFSVGAVNGNEELFMPQIYILISFLLGFLSIGPWIISACIKLALRN